jgi:hypothetical protein
MKRKKNQRYLLWDGVLSLARTYSTTVAVITGVRTGLIQSKLAATVVRACLDEGFLRSAPAIPELKRRPIANAAATV